MDRQQYASSIYSKLAGLSLHSQARPAVKCASAGRAATVLGCMNPTISTIWPEAFSLLPEATLTTPFEPCSRTLNLVLLSHSRLPRLGAAQLS